MPRVIRDIFPDSDVVQMLAGWGSVVDTIAGFAESNGDALYNSP